VKPVDLSSIENQTINAELDDDRFQDIGYTTNARRSLFISSK
jgi:hypothetical protein